MNQSLENKFFKNSKIINNDNLNKRVTLTCNLCKDFFKNPLQCSKCEMAFCKTCLTEWYTIKKYCPKGCNINFEDFKHTPKCFNDIIEALILEDAFKLLEQKKLHFENSNEICWNCKQAVPNKQNLILSEKDYQTLYPFINTTRDDTNEKTNENTIESTNENNSVSIANVGKSKKTKDNLKENSKDNSKDIENTITKASKDTKEAVKNCLENKIDANKNKEKIVKVNESSELSKLEDNSEYEFDEPKESKKSSNFTVDESAERIEKKKRKLKDKYDKPDKPESQISDDNSIVARSKKNQKKVDFACMEIVALKSNIINLPYSENNKCTDDSFKQFFNSYKCFKNTSTINTDDEVWSISSFSLNNSPIVVNGDQSGSINFWNVKNNILFNYIEGTVKESCNCLLPIIFDTEYEYIAASCSKDINIYHIKTGKLHKKLTGHTNAVCCLLKFELSSKWYIASGSVDNTIIIWEYEKLCFVKILLGAHSSIIYCLERICQSERTNLLVSGSVDTTIKIWNVEKGTPVRTINNDGGQGILSLLVITIENKEVLISGDIGGKIKMWDPLNGLLIKVFICKHKSKIWSIKTIELLGEILLVSGSDDGTIKISNPTTGNIITQLSGHHGSSWCITTLDLNDTIAIVSGSNDKTLKIWKLLDKKYF